MVDFLRKVEGKYKTKFVYPEVRDKMFVDIENFVKEFNPVECKRGIVFRENNLKGYDVK